MWLWFLWFPSSLCLPTPSLSAQGGYSAPSFSPWQGSFQGMPRTVPPHRRQTSSTTASQQPSQIYRPRPGKINKVTTYRGPQWICSPRHVSGRCTSRWELYTWLATRQPWFGRPSFFVKPTVHSGCGEGQTFWNEPEHDSECSRALSFGREKNQWCAVCNSSSDTFPVKYSGPD